MRWLDDIRPHRQYVFRPRRCRQRVATALAAGRAPAEVAVSLRLHGFEVDELLGDASFQALVAHYREVADLLPDERRARLVALAMEMLERLVATGDLRAVAFVLHEAARGRDPASSLARGVEAAIAKDEVPVAPAKARPVPPPASSHAAPPSDVEVGSAAGQPPRAAARPASEWAACAATLPDEATAAAQASSELARVRQRLSAAASQLRGLLRNEAERLGTAAPPPPPDPTSLAAAAIGRTLHHRAGPALSAAAELATMRQDFAKGRLPPQLTASSAVPPPDPG